MNAKASKRKRYVAPRLIEYGDLGRLIRSNPTGTGQFDGDGGKTGQYKTN